MINTKMISTSLFCYEAVKTKIVENQKLAKVGLVVVCALAAVAFVYRRLTQPNILPFDRWDVSLGLRKQTGLTQAETQDLLAASKNYPPIELVRRAFQNKDTLLASVGDSLLIHPPFREGLPLSLEDEKAVKVQSWAMSLLPFFSLFNANSIPWYDLLRPIQASPRLAYTIGFNCLAPFATQAIWKSVRDFLPSSLQEIGTVYLQQKGKFALASFIALLYLFYRMREERGILTNLTENFMTFHKAHRGLDHVPSYQSALKTVLQTIGMSQPGEANANILWYYSRNTHRTFLGEIGNVLGEITAAGRVAELFDKAAHLPSLKNLQIVEFNVKMFLTEYRNKDEVYRGWYETLSHLTRGGNVLVVFTEIDEIKSYLLPKKHYQPQSENGGQVGNMPRGPVEMPAEKILSDLIQISLKQGKIRCLMEMNEDDKQQMEESPELNRNFSSIRAPDITPQELLNLATRLYGTKEELQNLFAHMAVVMDKTPFSPADILDTISAELRTRTSSWRNKVRGPSQTQQIEHAEQNLHQILKIKEILLQKIWRERFLHQLEPQVLKDAFRLVENVLMPIYTAELRRLKQAPETTADGLIPVMQRRFARLFGPASAEERERLKKLSAQLQREVKGQDQAIDIICKAVEKWRTVPPRNGKPLVLFFAGSPGVGKSETATKLAYELNFIYGIEETASKACEMNVRRINLNRQKAGGIFGWDRIKGEILAHLLHRPTSVIILEEWDKMDDKERSCLLELLDDTQNYLVEPWGYSSNNGPFVDKSCAVFVLTSNISTAIQVGTSVDAVKQGIQKCYPDEKAKDADAFLSRVDAVVPFNEIAQVATANLIKVYLDEYEKIGVLSANRRGQVEQRLSGTSDSLHDARELQRHVQTVVFESMRD